MSRADDMKELAGCLSAAIAKARALDLPTSVDVLSMAMVEVPRALKAMEISEKNAPAFPRHEMPE